MRKLPQFGPLIVPTLVEIVLANVGGWFAGLFRLALFVALILASTWLFNSGRGTNAPAHQSSSFTKYLTPAPSPSVVPSDPLSAGAKRTTDTAAGPSSVAAPGRIP